MANLISLVISTFAFGLMSSLIEGQTNSEVAMTTTSEPTEALLIMTAPSNAENSECNGCGAYSHCDGPPTNPPQCVCDHGYTLNETGQCVIGKKFLVFINFFTAKNFSDVKQRMLECSNTTYVGLSCDGACIPVTEYRDCHPKCSDGADQACFLGYVKCDGCKCVLPEDADSMCLDRRRKCRYATENRLLAH